MLCGAMLALASCGGSETCKIGVQQGTTGELYLKGDADMAFAGYSNIECKSYNTAGLAVQAMIDGQINYVIIDNEVAKALVNQNPGTKVIDIALSAEEYAFGVDKSQDNIKAALNELLAEMKADGSLDALFAKYDALEYDDDGNVIGGDENIIGIDSADKDNNNAAGQLVVATNAEFAPWEYKEGNQYFGIDMEIAQLFATELGMELVIEDMDFDNVVGSVGKQNIDIAMSGITITAERAEVVNFSNPYYTSVQYVIYDPAQTTFESRTADNGTACVFWSDLMNKDLGVQRDTTGHLYVDGEIDGGVLDGTTGACTPFDNAQVAVDAISANRIDVVVVDELPAQFICNKNTTVNAW
jgi:polar amino acid transport system substrate-binding protein